MKKSILIGINYFDTASELQGCINDSLSLRSYLEKVGYTEFHMMSDSKDDPTFTLPNAPTRNNIITKMKEVMKDMKPGNYLFFLNEI